jgi:nitroimidazol reductase NimA-like FMN-containing flavoprotein (pyridoxamine 5'-phosphate oxidase superfamily)
LLNGNVIGRIGSYAHDRIYIVPVTYGYNDKYIYGHTIEGMKIIMMRSNPVVCFEVDQINDLNSWQSVII